MKRVMYIMRANLQIGATDGYAQRTFRGIVGDDAEVPDDIASILVAQGLAVLAPEKKPAAAKDPAEKPATKAPASRRKRQK